MARPSAPAAEPTVTLSQIAELAGVRPSAVSNWRKRFADFPGPLSSAVGGRDLFSMPAVEAWLADHDRLPETKVDERLLFEAANLLRAEADERRTIEILCAALALAYTVGDGKKPVAAKALSAIDRYEREDSSLVGVFEPLRALKPETGLQLLELIGQVERSVVPSLFEWMLARRPRFVETRTSERLIELLIRLSLDERAPSTRTVFDPAAGEGGLLLAAARAARPKVALIGQELNDAAWRIAKQRFVVHERVATLALGDSLLNDAHADLRADVVVCDPPYGAKVGFPDESIADSRWTFGMPSAGTTDFAWLQHAIHHLAEDGRGCVLLPAGTLFRGGREAEIRAQLIRRGAVEVVVALPAKVAEYTAVPLALWVVRRPRETREPAPVLLIDGTSPVTKSGESLDASLIDRIVRAVATWRAHEDVAESDRDFAVAVPVLEVLGPDSNLQPVRWTHQETVFDIEQRRREFTESITVVRRARDELLTHEVDAAELRGDPRSLKWVPVRQLVADGRAELIRGARVRAEDYVAEGTPTIRTRDLRPGMERSDEESCVDLGALRPTPALTQAGDVVVSPGSGRPWASVDQSGGHVLVFPVQALRLHGEWLDPAVVAAFLESPRNRRFVTGVTYGYARIDIRELELPMLPVEEASDLEVVLNRLDATAKLAREIAANADDARAALLDLGGYVKGATRSSDSTGRGRRDGR